MDTDNKGRLLKYLVTDRGVMIIHDGHPCFHDEDEAVFETFEDASMFFFGMISDRVARIEAELKFHGVI